MAFPVVATKGTLYNTATATANPHPIAYPSGISSGDLLIILGGFDGNNQSSFAATGFTLLTGTTHTGTSTGFVALYKFASGSESGTEDVSHSNPAEQGVAQMWRITGAHASQAPEATTAEGTSGAADPPSITPSWGSDDHLIIAAFGINGGHGGITTWSLPDDQVAANTGGSGSAGAAFCSDGLTGTSVNPDAFAHGSQSWVAATIAVRPAGAPTQSGIHRRIPTATRHYLTRVN